MITKIDRKVITFTVIYLAILVLDINDCFVTPVPHFIRDTSLSKYTEVTLMIGAARLVNMDFWG